jgi:hypothetical protein
MTANRHIPPTLPILTNTEHPRTPFRQFPANSGCVGLRTSPARRRMPDCPVASGNFRLRRPLASPTAPELAESRGLTTKNQQLTTSPPFPANSGCVEPRTSSGPTSDARLPCRCWEFRVASSPEVHLPACRWPTAVAFLGISGCSNPRDCGDARSGRSISPLGRLHEARHPHPDGNAGPPSRHGHGRNRANQKAKVDGNWCVRVR